ncbi:MAG TPA: hypothetical protein VER03_10805 [Bryobacteraceae bacterium]|nr:hypothetical protein [Bryobacteraceae bacterium]
MKVLAGLLVGLALIGASVSPRVTRNNLVSLEKLTDTKVTQLDNNSPAEVLGHTRGVYLEGYGVVFTAEVDPNPYAAPNPFRPQYTKADLDKLRLQKKARIDVLKKKMVESLVVMARGLEGVPANEQVVLAVTIPYWVWENSTGMPKQIMIQAPKSALLSSTGLEAALKVQEF